MARVVEQERSPMLFTPASYRAFMEDRDVSGIDPNAYKYVYDTMRLGTHHPRPAVDMDLIGEITNADRNLVEYLRDLHAGIRDPHKRHELLLFSSYVDALGHAAEASDYATRIQRIDIPRHSVVRVFTKKYYAKRHDRAATETTDAYRDVNALGQESLMSGNEKRKIERLLRGMYLAEQAAIELDPRVKVSYDPADVRTNRSVLLKSEVQARAIGVMYRKLSRVVENLLPTPQSTRR